jgi:cation transport regulator ChaC
MAKKPIYKAGDGSVISIIKENTTKHGKIKGKNKKQTKVLRGACVHHTTNHKGKVKPTIGNNDGKVCRCRLCGGTFKPSTYDKEAAENKIKGMREINNQAKYLAVALGTANENIRYFSELGSMIELFPKNYRKLASIAEKVESVKKKKKNRDNDNYSSLGSWR